jgi:hypothetical protein
MTDIDWSKAPEWADRLIRMSTTNRLAWACRNKYQYIDGAESFLFFDAPTDGFMLNQTVFVEGRPTTQPAAWNGEGLPPVVTVCEAKSFERGHERDWFRATVLYSSPCTIILDDYRGGEFVTHPIAMRFRPIRTPEQIAAESRAATIKRLAALCPQPRADFTGAVIEALLDAGMIKDDAQ